MTREGDNRTSVFLEMQNECHRQVSAYIFSMVYKFEDANDILQRTTIIMWEKFDDFQTGTNFAAWGMKIAYFEILAYRRKKASEKVIFSDHLLRQVEEVAGEKSKHADQRLKYLRECLKKIASKDLMLLRHRFEINESVIDLALRTGKSTQFIYRRLAAIQNILYNCIHRNISGEEI